MINYLLRRFAINSSRVHLLEANRAFAERIPAGALVLDAGAGSGPYRHLFGHAQYESADFSASSGATYVCDLAAIPVEDERFDFVVLNQVLEHVPDPAKVLAELCRVMKPEGKIICTAPLFYEEHMQPYDFYRYTQFAYPVLFERAGLKIEGLEWMEGYMGTVAYQLETAAKYLPASIGAGWRRVALFPLLSGSRLLFAVLAIIFYRLDIAVPWKARGYPKNYVVVAAKCGSKVGP